MLTQELRVCLDLLCEVLAMLLSEQALEMLFSGYTMCLHDPVDWLRRVVDGLSGIKLTICRIIPFPPRSLAFLSFLRAKIVR